MAAPVKPSQRISAIIGGKYELTSLLGTGGLGAVYAATHQLTGREVAVKLLHAGSAASGTAVERFLREARAAARLEHPNVVQVLDMGSEPDETVYMVLERLRGESLGERLKRRSPLELGETLAIVTPVMSALERAHEQGIVHRDVKPANIFISVDGTGHVVPKVLDFGVAKFLDASLGITNEGQPVGTPHYMSPEQVDGREDVGPSADIWAVSVVLYKCLSGELPFDAPNFAALCNRINKGAHKPLAARASALPSSVALVIDRGLIVDPAERHPSMKAFAEALLAAAGEAGLSFDEASITRPPSVERAAAYSVRSPSDISSGPSSVRSMSQPEVLAPDRTLGSQSGALPRRAPEVKGGSWRWIALGSGVSTAIAAGIVLAVYLTQPKPSVAPPAPVLREALLPATTSAARVRPLIPTATKAAEPIPSVAPAISSTPPAPAPAATPRPKPRREPSARPGDPGDLLRTW